MATSGCFRTVCDMNANVSDHPISHYRLGHSEAETARLVLQHQLYRPITHALFVAAGIGRGMKVLDLGSGAGDVAMLAAELVGPQGSVIGVDTNEAILDSARARTEAAGLANVCFVQADLGHLADADLPTDFDAVVGRWILMHVPDPASVLRAAAIRLRPGGLVVMQESDLELSRQRHSFPVGLVHEQLASWLTPAANHGGPGPNGNAGLSLMRTFHDSGLRSPQLRLEAPLGGGPDWPGYRLIAATARSLVPMIEELDRATLDEIDIDSLEARLRDDIVANHGVQILPTVIGAWTSV
jgi:2-polyprenyl-3-methyl-5-hydroxy-6-metoxy-1,4-benzoquinol methylase